MNEVIRARVRLFTVILLVILALHVIVIALFIPGRRSAAPADNPVVQQEVVEPPAAAPVESKPGFWARLFGRGSSTETAVEQAPKPPPAPVYRYKKPTGNPNFGLPLDFSHAVTSLPSKEVPGAAGVGTGIVVDLGTRQVLWQKDAHRSVPIASMVKMMTMLLTMESLEARPELSLNSPVKITKTALAVPRTGIVWLDPRETFPLSDLMKAVAIKSANDAAVQVAEFIGGSVDDFVASMNRRAVELGMTDSKFVSPCGLPDKVKGNSTSSARDMVLLAEQLLEYPDVMHWSGTQLDYIREGEKKTMLTTTNNLVNPRWPGVDGLKTGYISASGFCLTFSVLRDNRRIVGCVTGFKSARDRDRFCRKLINWSYSLSFPEKRK